MQRELSKLPVENFEWNSHLLVNEVAIHTRNYSGKRHLNVDWVPIIEDGVVVYFTVIIKDTSEVRKLNKRADAQRRELKMLGEIISATPAKFLDFVRSAKMYLKNTNELIKSQSTVSELINLVFINMHTLKGNARTYGLSYITEATHQAEQYYEEVRRSDEMAIDINRLRFGQQTIDDVLNEYYQIYKNRLATMANERSNEEFFEHLKRSVNGALSSNEYSASDYILHLSKVIRFTESVSIEALLRPIQKSWESIAGEIGKNVPTWSVDCAALYLSSEVVPIVSDVLTHIVRNSLDHGIEPAEWRASNKKDPSGRISVVARAVDDTCRIEIFDDGGGLDLSKLEKEAVSQGGIDPAELSDEAIGDVIFGDGVSTRKDDVTDLSGRGVGMSAVKSLIEQLNGNVFLEFTSPRSDGMRAFKVVIELPAVTCLVDNISFDDFMVV